MSQHFGQKSFTVLSPFFLEEERERKVEGREREILKKKREN